MLRDSMVSDSPGTGKYVRKPPPLRKNKNRKGRPPRFSEGEKAGPPANPPYVVLVLRICCSTFADPKGEMRTLCCFSSYSTNRLLCMGRRILLRNTLGLLCSTQLRRSSSATQDGFEYKSTNACLSFFMCGSSTRLIFSTSQTRPILRSTSASTVSWASFVEIP